MPFGAGARAFPLAGEVIVSCRGGGQKYARPVDGVIIRKLSVCLLVWLKSGQTLKLMRSMKVSGMKGHTEKRAGGWGLVMDVNRYTLNQNDDGTRETNPQGVPLA